MGTAGRPIRNRTRLAWAALPFLLSQATAYEAGPSSLSILEESLVKLKKESAALHQRAKLQEVQPLKSSSNGGAVTAGTGRDMVQVRSLEAKLSSDNHRLRRMLQRTSQQSEVNVPAASTQGAHPEESQVSLLSTSGAYGDHSLALLLRLLLLFAVINTALYLVWNMEGPTVEKVRRGAAQPLLRAIGRGTYEVEISELQVTNLPLTGPVVLSLSVCGAAPLLAEASCFQNLVKFQDRFRFQIHGGGSEGQNCVLRVSQSQETMAEVVLTTKDIMRRVHSKHGQQYFHYRMFPKEAHSAWRPSLSLRMREVEGHAGVAAPLLRR